MADDARLKFQEEVDQFLNDTDEEAEREDAAPGSKKDPNRKKAEAKKPVTEEDIFELLNNSNYSGVIYSLEEVTRHLKNSQMGITVAGKADESGGSKLSTFDRSLLDVNSWFFHKDLQEYLVSKAKGVQWDASMKVIKKFFTKPDIHDAETQTNNNDKEIIETLEDQKATLTVELNKLNKSLTSMKQDRDLVKRKNDDLMAIIEN